MNSSISSWLKAEIILDKKEIEVAISIDTAVIIRGTSIKSYKAPLLFEILIKTIYEIIVIDSNI